MNPPMEAGDYMDQPRSYGVLDDKIGPSGTYTDGEGVIHKVTIINEDPSIRFDFNNNVYDRNNETAFTFVSVDYDGWLSSSVPNNVWDKIINYCQSMKK